MGKLLGRWVARGRCCGPGPGLTVSFKGRGTLRAAGALSRLLLKCHPLRLTHLRAGWVLALHHPPPTPYRDISSHIPWPHTPPLPAQGSLALGHTAWDLPALSSREPCGRTQALCSRLPGTLPTDPNSLLALP